MNPEERLAQALQAAHAAGDARAASRLAQELRRVRAAANVNPAPMRGPAGRNMQPEQRATVQPMRDVPQNNDSLQSFARTQQGYGQNTGPMLQPVGRLTPEPAPHVYDFGPSIEAARQGGAQMDAAPVEINGQFHPAGTTADMVRNIPEGFIYDPRTGQYRDVNLEARARDRGGVDAFIGGGMQGVSLGAGDEILGGIASAIQGPAGGALVREQARAQLANDREDNPGAAFMGEIGGAITLPAPVIRGAGWLANLGRSAIAGAGYGGAYAFNTGEGGLQERMARVPGGAAIGAIGGAVAVPVARALSPIAQRFGRWASGIVGQQQYFRRGQLTERGRTVLRNAGINPDEVATQLQQQFARQAAQAANPQDAAAIASMAEFGIPPVRANVTGAVEDFATIEAARRGAMGEPARQRVGAVMDEQYNAMRQAGDRIATDLSGGNVFGQADAARGVMDGLRGAQVAAREAARGAYQALEAAGGGLRGTMVRNFGTQIGQALRMLNVRIPDDAANARGALQLLDDVFANADQGAVPFMQIERARQDLVRLNAAAQRGANGMDQRAMTEILGEFDTRLEGLMTTMMTEGNEGVLDLARNARNLWSQYRQTFSGRDAGSVFIQRMIDEDASPDQAVRWLFSAGRLGSGQFTSNIARQVKEVVGEASDAWSSVRQAAFRHLIQRTEGTAQPGPQQMRTAINEFLNGPATQELSRELFTSQERAMMRRFSGALARMVPPPGAVNYSNTGYEMARMAQRTFQALAGMVGMANAGPGGAMMGAGAARGLQNLAQSSAVRNALNPMPLRPAGQAFAAVPAPLAGNPPTMEQTQNRLRQALPQ